LHPAAADGEGRLGCQSARQGEEEREGWGIVGYGEGHTAATRRWTRELRMCGIVGYVGTEDCAKFLINGLKRLEYRGYDSAGVAVVGPNGLGVLRARGKLANLEKLVEKEEPKGALGIGHTR